VLADLARGRAELEAVRLDRANLLAAIRATLSADAACRTLLFAHRSYSNKSWMSSLFMATLDPLCAQSYLAARFHRALSSVESQGNHAPCKPHPFRQTLQP